jgi:N-acetylglucosamine-6-phosphate deacetylase
MLNSEKILIKGGRLVSPGLPYGEGDLLISGGLIEEVGGSITAKDAIKIDAHGLWVVPGFIDLHVHGGGGSEILNGTYEAVDAMSKVHGAGGTTAFLPSTATASYDDLVSAILATLEAMEKGTSGSQVLGINLEGPYLNVKKKGAQSEEYVRMPDLEEFEELWRISQGIIKMITVAPELEGAKAFIEAVKAKGIRVSAGHSDATYAQAMEGFQAGISHGTHVFNAMNSLHHREPGLLGAILLTPGITAELIADGVHIHPRIIELLYRLKGRDEICLITDAIAGTGLADGVYNLANKRVIIQDGICRLKDGTLAGSTLTMGQAVSNIVRFLGISLSDAVRMASLNPALAIGVAHRKGSLELGKDGDVVILDRELKVSRTIVKGKVVYGN